MWMRLWHVYAHAFYSPFSFETIYVINERLALSIEALNVFLKWKHIFQVVCARL